MEELKNTLIERRRLRTLGVTLKKKYVVAVSPFIGDAPISGPAKALMEAWGMPPTSKGTIELYKDFTDLFVQDERDTETVDGALRCDTLMINEEISVSLARTIMEQIKGKY